MKSAIGTLVCFPPQIDINPRPSGRQDLVTGGAGAFYNSMIYYMGLNVSLVPADSFGGCHFDSQQNNVTCDGIAGLLASGQADFSLFPLPATSLHFGPTAKDPVLLGPQHFDAETLFTSVPYEESHFVNATLSKTLAQGTETLVLTILCCFVSFLLINFSLHRTSFLTRVNVWQMVGLLLVAPTDWRLRWTHRRIAVASCLLAAFFYLQVILTALGSDMVVVTPARYLETLDQVAASNSTPSFMEGIFGSDSGIGVHGVIEARARERGRLFPATDRGAVMTRARLINDSVSIFGARSEAMIVIGMSCFVGEFCPPRNLRFSPPIQKVPAMTVYGRSIDPEVRRQLSRFFQHSVEAGVLDKTATLELLADLGDADKLTYCMARFSEEDTKAESVFHPARLAFFADMGILVIVSLAMAGLALVCELAMVRCRRAIRVHKFKKRGTFDCRTRRLPVIVPLVKSW